MYQIHILTTVNTSKKFQARLISLIRLHQKLNIITFVMQEQSSFPTSPASVIGRVSAHLDTSSIYFVHDISISPPSEYVSLHSPPATIRAISHPVICSQDVVVYFQHQFVSIPYILNISYATMSVLTLPYHTR